VSFMFGDQHVVCNNAWGVTSLLLVRFFDFEIDVVTILNGKNEADCKKVDIGERADEEH
jgi:hypothetical protein